MAALNVGSQNMGSRLRSDHLGLGICELFRLSFKNGDELVRSHVSCVLSPFVLSELAFCRFSGEVFYAGLQLRVSAKAVNCVRLSRQNNLHHRPQAAIE